jgi:ATP-dependent DNA helicase RecG
VCDVPAALPLLVYQYRRTPAGEPAATRPPGTLLVGLLRVLELISARLDTTPVNLPGGQQVQLADLPEAAVREAVANAAIHRDYRLSGPVRVEHAPTRLVVTSPGPLVQGVTVDNILTTSSRPRNARLAAAVRTLGLAEEAGVGVDRMYREMVRVGHVPPQFDETADQVCVTLLGGAPNTHLTRYVATLPQAEADDADAMLVLFTLLTKRVVAAQQLAPLLQKQQEEVEFVLRRLAAEPAAMLEPTRETARRHHPNYRLREHVITTLGPAVTYRRRTTDEYDRKVVELVRASGSINARVVKVALDLDSVPASRLLADLVNRRSLTKISEAQRGPSVAYGPGSDFPAAPARSRGGRQRSATGDRGERDAGRLF